MATTLTNDPLADLAYRSAPPGSRPDGAQTPLAAAPLWQLKDHADALLQNQPEAGPNLSSGALKQIPSRNRKIPNFSGYKAASSTRNPGDFTEIIDPKQGDFACQ